MEMYNTLKVKAAGCIRMVMESRRSVPEKKVIRSAVIITQNLRKIICSKGGILNQVSQSNPGLYQGYSDQNKSSVPGPSLEAEHWGVTM